MEGIVVGVDESPHARAALRCAVELATNDNQPVTAVMAWGSIDQQRSCDSFDPQYGEEAAVGVLAGLVAGALGGHHDVRCVAVCDLPGAALRDAAKDASLLVVGARGMGGFRGLMLGSVSREVLHEAACPVAVVHDDASRSGKLVIVGVDGSAPLQRAVEWALEHAAAGACRSSRCMPGGRRRRRICGTRPHSGPEELARRADSFLDAQLARIDTTGVAVEHRVVADRPSAALLEPGTLASLIVVGSRGRGQLASAVLGSVSDQLAHHATCPWSSCPEPTCHSPRSQQEQPQHIP